MRGENMPHHIFIDAGYKGFIDLLRDPWTARPWVTLSPKAPTVGLSRRWSG
jgi:hypothetical protein